MNSLRIEACTTNSLSLQRQETETLIMSNKINVLLISKTHLTKNNKFCILGYRMYHTAHPDGTARGETAVFIKNSIKHHEKPKRCTKAVQVTSISTREQRGDSGISTSYCPPNQGIEEEMSDGLFYSLGSRFITGTTGTQNTTTGDQGW